VSHAVKSVVAEKKIVEKKGEIPTCCLCIYLNERQPNTCEFCGSCSKAGPRPRSSRGGGASAGWSMGRLFCGVRILLLVLARITSNSITRQINIHVNMWKVVGLFRLARLWSFSRWIKPFRVYPRRRELQYIRFTDSLKFFIARPRLARIGLGTVQQQ